jgi:hypothetical protein
MNNSSETGLLCPMNIHTISSLRINYYNYANIDFQYPKFVKYAFTIFIIKSSPVTGLEWPRGFQEVKVPRFHDNGTGRW